IVAAGTVDHLRRETIAGYSSFAVDFSPGIDVCAPSSSNIGLFIPPINVGVTTTIRVGTGTGTTPGTGETVWCTNGTIVLNAGLTAPVAVGGNVLSTDGVPGAGIHSSALLRRAANNNVSEWVRITGSPAANTYSIQNGVRHSYSAGDRLIFFSALAGAPGDYTLAFAGTSAAAPMVAGVVALMLTANPNLTFMDVRQIIRRTSVPINIGHRGPRPANITTAAAYTDSNRASVSNTDLNWRHFTGGAGRASRPLILANGLMDTNGNASVNSNGAPTYPSNTNAYPQWFINL
ncbi:MAG: S8 family serine peptidase, partial [bacterium]|nr:S8 family serine peptidase [bacterium]